MPTKDQVAGGLLALAVIIVLLFLGISYLDHLMWLETWANTGVPPGLPGPGTYPLGPVGSDNGP